MQLIIYRKLPKLISYRFFTLLTLIRFHSLVLLFLGHLLSSVLSSFVIITNGKSSNSSKKNMKPYNETNIKTAVPLILDLN